MRARLGKTLEDLRRIRGLKQYQMARKANVCRSTYAGWEKDKGCPSFLQVYLLTIELDVRMEDLVAAFLSKQKSRTGK